MRLLRNFTAINATGCVSRFRSRAVGLWTTLTALPTNPRPPPPNKRSIDALGKPVNLTRRLNSLGSASWSPCLTPILNGVRSKFTPGLM